MNIITCSKAQNENAPNSSQQVVVKRTLLKTQSKNPNREAMNDETQKSINTRIVKTK